MPADAVGTERRFHEKLARGVLVFVVLLDSYLLASLPFPAGDWQDRWAFVTIALVLAGNVYVFFALRRALRSAFVVQCVAGAYGTFVAVKILWLVATLARDGMHPAIAISFVLAGALGVGQVVVALVVWRLRQLSLVP